LRISGPIVAPVAAALLAGAFLAACASAPRDKGRTEGFSRITLRWPVSGPVSSGFGNRQGHRHDGIDILAPRGTVVRAAESGVVVYAGNGMRGYGNVVILDHGNDLTTRYGHLESIRVEPAETVDAGAPIGTVGRTGNATMDHLHFEVRFDNRPVDPTGFLSPP